MGNFPPRPSGSLWNSAKGTLREFGGSGRIRTLGAFRPIGFLDRCLKPLSHTSNVWEELGPGACNFPVSPAFTASSSPLDPFSSSRRCCLLLTRKQPTGRSKGPPCCTSSGELSLRSEGAIPQAQCGGSIFQAWAGFEPATPSRSNQLNYQAEFFGWGSRTRTYGTRNQNPMPYQLGYSPRCSAVLPSCRANWIRHGGEENCPRKPLQLRHQRTERVLQTAPGISSFPAFASKVRRSCNLVQRIKQLKREVVGTETV